MDGQVREGGNWSKQAALTNWKVQMDSQVREGGKWSEQGHAPEDEQVREGGNLWMGKSGREGIYGWASQGGRESEQGSGTNLWMGKLGREGIRASERHSPMDGQVREGGNWSKQVALTYGWASQGGGEVGGARSTHLGW